MKGSEAAECGSTGSDETSRFHAFPSGNTGQPASDGTPASTPASPAAIIPASAASESERTIGPPHAERASNTQPMRIYGFKRFWVRTSTRSHLRASTRSACPPDRDPGSKQRQRSGGEPRRGALLPEDEIERASCRERV